MRIDSVELPWPSDLATGFPFLALRVRALPVATFYLGKGTLHLALALFPSKNETKQSFIQWEPNQNKLAGFSTIFTETRKGRGEKRGRH